jgi:DNA-binding winged helix-turn-helix (wHTH) protein/TolB-like protein/Flp pilus assembly protein TadD
VRRGTYTDWAEQVLLTHRNFPENFLKVSMSTQPSNQYQFGPFVLNPADRSLLRDGRLVALRPKAFDLLLVFVTRPNTLFRKEELMEALWPGVAVEENNLDKTVSTLRHALGRSGDGVIYIETVPKHGYRFIPEGKVANGNGTEPERVFEMENRVEEVLDHEPTAVVGAAPLIENGAEAPLVGRPTAAPEARKVTTTIARDATGLLSRRNVIIAAILLVLSIGSLGYVWRSRLRSVTPQTEIKSLAVLPLKSLDAGENYLGLGIADAVIRRISQTGKLIVRPTSAVRRYLNGDKDAITAARELNADAVLEGSIQRADDRLRVSVSLLRTSDGASLWAESFDMRTADVFAIQDTVAQQVASRLRLRLDPVQQARLSKHSTTNLIAYEYYVRGVYNLDRRSFGEEAKPQMEATIDYFKKAIEADPDFALAHAQLANAYIWMANFIEEQPVWAERTRQEINRADALDPQLAETHVARHYLLGSAYEGWQTEAAVRELLLAQRLNPNVGHVELGSIYYHLGLEDLGDRAYQRALDIDPTSEHVKYMIHAHIRLVNKYDEWLAAYQKFNSKAPPTTVWYLMGKGRLDEAQKQLAENALKYPNNPGVKYQQAFLAALKGDFRSTKADITFMLSDNSPQAFNYHHATYKIACLYALGGKSNEAVKWLRETAAKGFPSYTLFEREPYLDRIRQAPEFIRFMEELKVDFERYKREFS